MSGRTPFGLEDTCKAWVGFATCLVLIWLGVVMAMPSADRSGSRAMADLDFIGCGMDPDASLDLMPPVMLAIGAFILLLVVVPKSDLLVTPRPRQGSACFASLMRRPRVNPLWTCASACIAVGLFGLVQCELDGIEQSASPPRASMSPATGPDTMESLDFSLLGTTECGVLPFPAPETIGSSLALIVAGVGVFAGTWMLRSRRDDPPRARRRDSGHVGELIS